VEVGERTRAAAGADRSQWARLWFGATAACVLTGVLVNVFVAADAKPRDPHLFHASVERAFNVFAYFTIQSNLLIGGTTVLLVLRLERGSTVFRAFRMAGLLGIVVTGIVYHVALARLLELDSWALFGDQLVHTVVPILAVVGWLLFGPRRSTSARIALWALIFPAAWIAFTVIRGAIIHWYPYPFIDVTQIGYGKAILNGFWVLLLLLGLAMGVNALDRRLPTR
jgi:hypothetical protein